MKLSIGKNRRTFLFCLFFLLTASFPLTAQAEDALAKNDPAASADAGTVNTRTDELVAKARSLDLAHSNQWRALLLYQKKHSGFKSIITAPEFFLAPDGNTNPQAELEADLRSFRQGIAVDRFPARWQYLKSNLAEHEDDFPERFDQSYVDYKAKIQPTGAMIVYPAGFMQNPASMFGHTFLVFQNSKHNRLLGQSITFSANNTEPPGLRFALKGLFGLYRGYYAIDSYAKQIIKYSNMDKRDIWEYNLRLSSDELDLLYRHAIELNLMYTPYLYISRNCTTGLMYLLSAIYPDEPLLQTLGTMAEPVEALKIMYEKGLLEPPVFRPSIHTQLVHEKAQLPAPAAKAVKKYCTGKCTLEDMLAAATTEEEIAQMLTTASDYLKYLISAGKLSQTDYQKRFMPVLRAMSHRSFATESQLTSDDYPHESHDSHKIALTGGVYGTQPFGRISFRLVNHDLMDEERGLNKNTQMDFFTGSVAVYPAADSLSSIVSVERLMIADIFSIPACDSYFLNKSMDAVVGMERTAFSADSNFLAFRFKMFEGISCKVSASNQLYLLGGIDFYAHPDFDVYIDPYAGAETGLLTTAGRWKQHLSAQVEQGIFKNDGSTSTADWRGALVDKDSLTAGNRLQLSLAAEERITLSRNTALSAKYTFRRAWHTNFHKAELTLHVNY